jgi:hypothetical protein
MSRKRPFTVRPSLVLPDGISTGALGGGDGVYDEDVNGTTYSVGDRAVACGDAGASTAGSCLPGVVVVSRRIPTSRKRPVPGQSGQAVWVVNERNRRRSRRWSHDC